MNIGANVRKNDKKPWVLAPTLSKTVGAEAPTSPIQTRTLPKSNATHSTLLAQGCSQIFHLSFGTSTLTS